MKKVDLNEEVKATVLRPVADMFRKLTRQIDSGDYELPKTEEEALAITEGYIDQAWKRLEEIIEQEKLKAEDDLLSDLSDCGQIHHSVFDYRHEAIQSQLYPSRQVSSITITCLGCAREEDDGGDGKHCYDCLGFSKPSKKETK